MTSRPRVHEVSIWQGRTQRSAAAVSDGQNKTTLPIVIINSYTAKRPVPMGGRRRTLGSKHVQANASGTPSEIGTETSC
ncbi:uncharacterized protein DMAD_03020 [Drosophila madeirensis]|uniref:Uncharacterized protein n=1 Tax=Drosophila madeirensis TaxID=30013 RepID=A0AAU9G8T6_DROMD